MNFYIGLLLVIIGSYFFIADTIIVNKIITAILISFNYIVGMYLIYDERNCSKKDNEK